MENSRSREPGSAATPGKGNRKARLYEDLKHQILTLQLGPDEDLDELDLCRRYGLSRTPVREVFRRLSGEGYAYIRENAGARVAPMNHATLRHFFLAAPMIYAATGRLAARHFRPAQLALLRDTQEQFRQAGESGDMAALVLKNNRFHEIMGEMSGNIYLQASLNRLLVDHARIGHTFYLSHDGDMAERQRLAAGHHDQFIDALAAHDEDAIVRITFEHWELSRQNMEMFITPAGLDPHLPHERAETLST
ncbi:GntR family transcriptional regulator [Castellaniella defragrans]|uniref:DNA-binding GntR family transcriptional regulator n=1 Tax=Castellaniella defragrans TaxID=75697 RepID=A0A7W9WNU8_CASDE|nr:GntR family transcriptional regulator [Castellaniella defragrans]KAB0623555.1 GntR family transcriptional regulator [Castellaniella defragrans]MBB6083958.1 DNA-binding GntR family transcriptional regulator [Castellaniella defragrans]